ncbi:MAG: competence/damage-inducible protein A [Acidobacteriota bacterium]|nr:MAG: competence/damage-inducible protein A [Acidobacteriota bacterium]
MAVAPAIRTAEIIAVGSELLARQRIDTNSLFLAERLQELGIELRRKHVVGDHPAELRDTIADAIARVDLVITTGGLGPTDDDLTREAVAAVLGRRLAVDPEVLAIVAARFERRGVPMPSVNRRQAEVIEGARWLPNPNGTAPGQVVDTGDRLIVLLPGPPREMQPMFLASVVPVLAARASGRQVRRRTVRTTGFSESQVEEIAQPIYSRFAAGVVPIDTTVLASPGLVELHLSGAAEDVDALEGVLDRASAELVAALGDAVFTTDERSLEEVVGAELAARQLMIAAAESCTGGLLLQRLTDIPGSSAWVLGGVVAYANAVKVEALGVGEDTLAAHGAVSEAVARAMAEGVRRRLGADVGVGITGVAGPGGGSDEKPVGTVWIAVAAGDTHARRFLFPGDRQMIRQFAASAALNMVRRAIGAKVPAPDR